MVQLSHPYMTTGKTIALTRWTFVSKVMSLLFNMLSSLVTAFLPRSKHLLILWLQSPSAVRLEPKKIVCHRFHCFSIYCHEVMGLDAMIFLCWMFSFKPTFSLSSSLSSRDSLVLHTRLNQLYLLQNIYFIPDTLVYKKQLKTFK